MRRFSILESNSGTEPFIDSFKRVSIFLLTWAFIAELFINLLYSPPRGVVKKEFNRDTVDYYDDIYSSPGLKKFYIVKNV